MFRADERVNFIYVFCLFCVDIPSLCACSKEKMSNHNECVVAYERNKIQILCAMLINIQYPHSVYFKWKNCGCVHFCVCGYSYLHVY